MTTTRYERWTRRIGSGLLLAALAAAALLAFGAARAAASPAGTQKATAACWKDVVNDWLRNQPNVVGTYPIPCYTQAIQHLDSYPDIQQYSSAPDDIHRALLAALRDKHNGPGSSGGQSSTPSSGGGSSSSSGGGSSSSTGGGTSSSSGGGSSSSSGGGSSSSSGGGSSSSSGGGNATGSTGAGSNNAGSKSTGAKGGGAKSTGAERSGSARGVTPVSKSFVTKLFDSVGPGNAQSIPLPLLVLAGLAVLLLLAAVATWLAKRIQARRMAPAPAPAERRS